jgi:hypothetical protein
MIGTAALAALLTACSATAGPSPRPAPAQPSSSSPAPGTGALRSWWTSVQGDVSRLADDLSTGDSSPAALTALQNDVAALQADPGFPSGSPAGASAWHTALADFASAVSALQEGSTDTADTLFSQGTTALDTVLASFPGAS